MKSHYSRILFLAATLAWSVSGQLSDPDDVGPLTSSDAKWATKVCDVTDYGAETDGSGDLGTPLLDAFDACKSGGVVNIPSGDYNMTTFVTLSGGNAWAINLEGTIYRNGGADSGNMILIEDSTDFELYSSDGKGAMQGYGFQYLENGEYGPRLLRLADVTNFAVHDIALVDSPAFHLVMDTCTNGEVYNTIIRGANEGGLDGIDVWGSNIWIHDVEVTNKDECVTVKNPSDHMLIENIYCNWSGGCAMGSLADDTDISSITYTNVYTQTSNQMYMFKSNGGNGTVSSVVLSNFIGHNNAYSLDINAYWSSETTAAGDGVLYRDITISNWTGDCADGAERGPVYIICPTDTPCEDIVVEDFAIWTDEGSSEWYKCANAYGSGVCLKSGSDYTSYATVTTTLSAAPAAWSAAYMPSDLSAGLGISTSIAIPTVPTTFFPGATPISSRAYS